MPAGCRARVFHGDVKERRAKIRSDTDEFTMTCRSLHMRPAFAAAARKESAMSVAAKSVSIGKERAMNSNDYTTSFMVDQTPQQVFDAVTNVRGWWSGDIEGATDKLGAEFTYRYQDL